MIGQLISEDQVVAVLGDDGIWKAKDMEFAVLLNKEYNPRDPDYERGASIQGWGVPAVMEAANDNWCEANYPVTPTPPPGTTY